jgi:predicted metal-dependent hydrolase
MKYDLRRSARKNITIFIRAGGKVEVRAPHGAGVASIEAFLRKKADWIRRMQAKVRAEEAERETIRVDSETARRRARERAVYLTARAPVFARRMGVRYGGIRIGRAKSRWGSCTFAGDLCFTYRMAFLPEDLKEYILVHELAHRKEMNHAPDFWRVVEAILPDYRERKKALRLFSRATQFIETRD